MNHGDRVTADALLCMVMDWNIKPKSVSIQNPNMTMGYRRERAVEAAKKASQW